MELTKFLREKAKKFYGWAPVSQQRVQIMRWERSRRYLAERGIEEFAWKRKEMSSCAS